MCTQRESPSSLSTRTLGCLPSLNCDISRLFLIHFPLLPTLLVFNESFLLLLILNVIFFLLFSSSSLISSPPTHRQHNYKYMVLLVDKLFLSGIVTVKNVETKGDTEVFLFFLFMQNRYLSQKIPMNIYIVHLSTVYIYLCTIFIRAILTSRYI